MTVKKCLFLFLLPFYILPSWGQEKKLWNEPPIYSRFLDLEALSPWTQLSGEKAVPLTLSADQENVVLSLIGGWLVLGFDLEPKQETLYFLRPGEGALREGSPWVFSLGQGKVVLIDGSTRVLRSFLLNTGTVISRDFQGIDLTHGFLTDQSLELVSSRKTYSVSTWDSIPQETVPIPFFPKEIQNGYDGSLWGLDNLTYRIWFFDEGFFTPLVAPTQLPSRPITMVGSKDIYLLAGSGWLGAWSKDGKRLWLIQKDHSGRELPQDPRLKAGPRGVYLLSPFQKTVQYFTWDGSPQKQPYPVRAPEIETIILWVQSGLDYLEKIYFFKEAEGLATYGIEYLRQYLKSDPFANSLRDKLEDWQKRRTLFKDALVGFGTFKLSWDFPNGKPLANWEFSADDNAKSGEYGLVSQIWLGGKPLPIKEGKISAKAKKALWPGLKDYFVQGFDLPGFINVLFSHKISGQKTWVRVFLPPKPMEN